MSDANSPIEKAIEALGGPTKAATALGLSNPSVILNWRKRGQVPADKVLAVEEASGISRHELRPDVFGTGKASAA
jgi:DNA-binding transcriptional regulator YdaS (Cro superfamily)